MKPVIFLFDVDGVLVIPGGYRAAVQATINHFARSIGLPEAAPDEETIAIFEAQGIICEWDMIAFSLAILLNTAADHLPAGSCTSLSAMRTALSQMPTLSLHVDYPSQIRRLGAYVRAGEAPADVFLSLSQAGQDDDLFPNLSGQPIVFELFAHTRKLTLSATTRIFEHLVLGHNAYHQSLGLPVEMEVESYLLAHDQPLLRMDVRERLLALSSKGVLHMAAFTARPSGWHTNWPDGSSLPAMFAPEAEIALEMVGLQSIPLVGYGQMGGFALQLNLPEEALLKPSAWHAVAAMAAAWTNDRTAALEWTSSLYTAAKSSAVEHDLPKIESCLPASVEVHIFEDSSVGMMAGIQAGEQLRAIGIEVALKLWGVATHTEKIAALQAVGAQRIFADVNQAVEFALQGD